MVRGATTVGNWSAVVTGVLLAFNLPASIPWWIVVMGDIEAIADATGYAETDNSEILEARQMFADKLRQH